jgi:hypothetical protein
MLHQRHPREADAAVVGHVLAERQLAVQLHVVDRRVAAVLLVDAGGALLERLAVGRRPPLAHVAGRVEAASLVVEPVRQLVAHDAPAAPRFTASSPP